MTKHIIFTLRYACVLFTILVTFILIKTLGNCVHIAYKVNILYVHPNGVQSVNW